MDIRRKSLSCAAGDNYIDMEVPFYSILRFISIGNLTTGFCTCVIALLMDPTLNATPYQNNPELILKSGIQGGVSDAVTWYGSFKITRNYRSIRAIVQGCSNNDTLQLVYGIDD